MNIPCSYYVKHFTTCGAHVVFGIKTTIFGIIPGTLIMQASSANGIMSVIKRTSWIICRRNIGLTAVIADKVATDPIQKLFVDKVKEYAQKSKASGGKLFEASPEVEKEYRDELSRIEKQFGGGKGVDLTKFPTFTFEDPTIDSINLTEKK